DSSLAARRLKPAGVWIFSNVVSVIGTLTLTGSREDRSPRNVMRVSQVEPGRTSVSGKVGSKSARAIVGAFRVALISRPLGSIFLTKYWPISGATCQPFSHGALVGALGVAD